MQARRTQVYHSRGPFAVSGALSLCGCLLSNALNSINSGPGLCGLFALSSQLRETTLFAEYRSVHSCEETSKDGERTT